MDGATSLPCPSARTGLLVPSILVRWVACEHGHSRAAGAPDTCGGRVHGGVQQARLAGPDVPLHVFLSGVKR